MLSERMLNSDVFEEAQTRLDDGRLAAGEPFNFTATDKAAADPYVWKVCVDCFKSLSGTRARSTEGWDEFSAHRLFIHDKCWTSRVARRSAQPYLS